ncbi:hypothetical protein ACFQZ4_37640 [Catellatospora coxensis]
MYGNKIQFTGSGTLMQIKADGTMATVDKTTRRGSGYGDRFEMIHSGTTKLNYVADDKTINYSNPQATGWTTLKVNGSQRAKERLKATITPRPTAARVTSCGCSARSIPANGSGSSPGPAGLIAVPGRVTGQHWSVEVHKVPPCAGMC